MFDQSELENQQVEIVTPQETAALSDEQLGEIAGGTGPTEYAAKFIAGMTGFGGVVGTMVGNTHGHPGAGAAAGSIIGVTAGTTMVACASCLTGVSVGIGPSRRRPQLPVTELPQSLPSSSHAGASSHASTSSHPGPHHV
jgi:hypothetical protein